MITFDYLVGVNKQVCEAAGEQSYVINESNLRSALSVQDWYEDSAMLASALVRSITIAHGFLDGNKRTAAVVGAIVQEYTCSEDTMISCILAIAQGSLKDVQDIANTLYPANYVSSAVALDQSYYDDIEKGIAYKVFKVKHGKLYPPMVANAGGADTPVGVWLEAEEGEFAGLSKTGRPQVKQAKGGQTLSFRPGWHLGDIPRAKQFDRKNKLTGEMEFPKDFIWAKCQYVMKIDYQPQSDEQGYMRTSLDEQGNVVSRKSDKYQHSLAGLPYLPKDGYYKYRTNPNPDTVPWVITGAMKVLELLGDEEVNNILLQNGVAPIHRQGGDKTVDEILSSN